MYVFNVFTGTLDWTAAVVPGAPVTPTVVPVNGNLTLAQNTQMLFRRTIVLLAGAQVVAASGAILVGV